MKRILKAIAMPEWRGTHRAVMKLSGIIFLSASLNCSAPNRKLLEEDNAPVRRLLTPCRRAQLAWEASRDVPDARVGEALDNYGARLASLRKESDKLRLIAAQTCGEDPEEVDIEGEERGADLEELRRPR